MDQAVVVAAVVVAAAVAAVTFAVAEETVDAVGEKYADFYLAPWPRLESSTYALVASFALLVAVAGEGVGVAVAVFADFCAAGDPFALEASGYAVVVVFAVHLLQRQELMATWLR